MEKSGEEPDLIVMLDGRMAYVDCCMETTKERKSLCYDRATWKSESITNPQIMLKVMLKWCKEKLQQSWF